MVRLHAPPRPGPMHSPGIDEMNNPAPSLNRPPHYGRWRAASLATVYLLMTAHILHWKISGKTLAPLELNEVMYTLELGIVTAGFIFMLVAVLATAIFGRFFCSWGCHILALEDLSAWILQKMRIRPKPVRSRVLIWVPVIAMFYMFAWPQVARLTAGEPMPALHLRTDAGGWASFMTTDFWRNLPGPGITILTFVVCGFAVVYFLGSRAFCTYACPYGAVFSLADRIAPGRIMAKGDCSKCGICTAVCQSRVRVHEEVMEFGRVVNPSCLKDLDCVAACPDGALGYGLGMPAVFERSKSSRLSRKPYDFTPGEDLLIAAVFITSLAILRGLYDLIPFLLTLALGGILGYAAVLAVRLCHRNHVKINNLQLRINGRLTRAGISFVLIGSIAAAVMIHSAFIRYHEFQGKRHYQLANPGSDSLDTVAHESATTALGHLEFCNTWGLIRPRGMVHRLAVLHAAIGRQFADRNDLPNAIEHLEKSCRFDPDAAPVLYNLGVLLAATGRIDAAVSRYRQSIAIDPSDPEVHNNLGYLLLERGEPVPAEAHFRRAITLNPAFAHPHFNLGRILQARGAYEAASREFERAVQLEPAYLRYLTRGDPAGDGAAATGSGIRRKGNP